MSGEVVHFELPADDPERARKFYSSILGWKMDEVPGRDYTMVSTGMTDEKGMPKTPGYIGGGISRRGDPLNHPLFMIIVDDISATERTIEKHGGTIVQKKQAIGDGSLGHIGYFKDSEGNVLGLYQAGTIPPGGHESR